MTISTYPFCLDWDAQTSNIEIWEGLAHVGHIGHVGVIEATTTDSQLRYGSSALYTLEKKGQSFMIVIDSFDSTDVIPEITADPSLEWMKPTHVLRQNSEQDASLQTPGTRVPTSID